MMSSASHTTKPHPIIGYTTRRHLIIDLDDTTLTKTMKLVDMIMKEYPEVGSCLILLSSKGRDRLRIKYSNYQRPYHKRDRLNLHLVFNNLIGYNKACRIIGTLAGLFILDKDYLKIREFRGDMTLRTTPKINMMSYQGYPEELAYVVNPYSKKIGNYIKKYLRFLAVCRSLPLPELETQSTTNDHPDRADTSTQDRTIDPLD